MQEVINPALEENKIVICDRFWGSMMSDHHYVDGVSAEEVSRVEFNGVERTTVDLTLVLDVPVEVAMRRETGPVSDWKRLERVRNGYLTMAGYFDWPLVDRNHPMIDVFQDVWTQVDWLISNRTQ